MSLYKLFTDGGARGNPGPAGAGVVLKDEEGNVVVSLGKYLNRCTNNEAEYSALLLGLETALENQVESVECYLDSELVVKQLNGEYKVKNARLSPLYNKAKVMEKQFDSINYIHVKRDKNAEADFLVNQAIDDATSV